MLLLVLLHIQPHKSIHSRNAGVKGNDQADRLSVKATIKSGLCPGRSEVLSGLCPGRSEVLRSLRNYMWAQSQSTSHHRPSGGKRTCRNITGKSWQSLKRWERAVINQTNTGTVPTATMRNFLRKTENVTLSLNWPFNSKLEEKKKRVKILRKSILFPDPDRLCSPPWSQLLALGVFKPSCSTPFPLFLRLVSVYRPFQLYFIPKTLSMIPPFSAPFLQLIST